MSRTRLSKLVLAIAILALPALVRAAPKKKEPEKYLSTISKAQELMVNQQRGSALQLLVQEIEKEKTNSKALGELKKALHNFSEIFLTERAQKEFELGRSLSIEETDLGTEKFTDALALEPGNLKIIKELARNFLVKKECAKTLEYAKQGLLQNPFSTDFFLLKLQAKACLGKIEDIEAEAANPYIDKTPIEPYLDLVTIQHLYGQEKYREASEAINKMKPTKLPEYFYWKGMVKSKLGQAPTVEYETFLNLCKEAKSKLREKFPYEPRTCKEQKAIEQVVEKLRSEG